MRPVFELKKEMTFSHEMNGLIDILRKTAIAQFQLLNTRKRELTHAERYLELLESFFKPIDFNRVKHPIIKNPITNLLLVIVTTDMGFLGGLNTSVIETAFRQIDEKAKAHILLIGEKGQDYLEGMERDFTSLPGITTNIHRAEIERVSQYIFRTALREKLGQIMVVYPKFFSFSHQETECLQLLPYSSGEETSGVAERIPITYEPFLDKIVDYLLRKWLFYRMRDVFWHSKLSEFATRSRHLEGSMIKLEEEAKGLALQYFRSKHEVTDRNLRDIFGGRLVNIRNNLKAREKRSLANRGVSKV